MDMEILIVAQGGDALRANAERDNLVNLLTNAVPKQGLNVRIVAPGLGSLESADPSSLHLLINAGNLLLTTHTLSAISRALAKTLITWLVQRNKPVTIVTKDGKIEIPGNIDATVREKAVTKIADAMANRLHLSPLKKRTAQKNPQKRKRILTQVAEYINRPFKSINAILYQLFGTDENLESSAR